jgi:hypothetical protein
MVILDPPLLGRTEWSPLHIAQNVYERKLPVSGGLFDDQLIGIALIYLLMPLALLALYRPGPPKALVAISTAGFIPSFLGKWWHHAFMYTFGWEYFGAGHMRRGPAWWILPWIMPALLTISFARNFDQGEPENADNYNHRKKGAPT